MSTKLEILIPKEDAEEFGKLLTGEQIEFSLGVSDNFDGESVASFILVLTPVITAFLANLYKKRLEANKSIVYKSKGFEVQGVSEQALLQLVEINKTPKKEILPPPANES